MLNKYGACFDFRSVTACLVHVWGIQTSRGSACHQALYLVSYCYQLSGCLLGVLSVWRGSHVQCVCRHRISILVDALGSSADGLPFYLFCVWRELAFPRMTDYQKSSCLLHTRDPRLFLVLFVSSSSCSLDRMCSVLSLRSLLMHFVGLLSALAAGI